ncbi:amidohydrolase [Thermosinus carboxydivorans Nor1]|uniref:Amidohydrolase n=1 Tax=Thermosinus carboxydivorans Nor1 TaxID=401526 RepID=A1HNV2_9FIRM|nr:amidohydrolase [Thermosinus carboxydivorans]EAX48454.1 amidohydrolase [Thermosinus carboxydivorans Nor1]
MEQKIHALVKENHEYIVGLRRHFHAHPEIGGQEFATQQKVMAELKAMGLEPRPAAGTGVIAEIKGGKPGKTVAIRADMDALPIQDEVEQPYRSQIPGVCHACGHDGHTAMLLGVAKVFTRLQAELPGNVRLLFQPSEERFPGGALAMIKDGAMAGVDAVIGAHLWQPLDVGTLGITYGPMMASPDEFSITIKGRGGHGSMPHETIDPLYVGAQIVLALKTITGNDINANELAVLSIGVFKSGDAFNIIPDTALLKGTVRTFASHVREKVFSRIEQVCQGICAAAGASFTLEKYFGYPPVVNDPAVAKVVATVGREVLGGDKVIELSPAMVGEDFSYYQEQAPGCFMFVGVGNKEKGIVYPHHHPKFDIDERSLGYGVEIMVRTALRLVEA